MTTLAPEVPDLLEVPVPIGARALVVSDLHLGQRATPASEATTAELARAVEAIAGPGVVVLAGDCWELLAEPHRDPKRALAAHPRLASALHAFAAGAEHRVLVLPGNHDGCLGWHAPAINSVRRELGAELAFAVDLVLATGEGDRTVRVEHGHRLDPSNRFADPRDPGETPLGHHVVTDLLPMLDSPASSWVDGLALVAEPTDAAAFVGSRLFYRRTVPRCSVLLVPWLLAGVLWILGAAAEVAWAGPAAAWAAWAGLAAVLAAVLGAAWWAFAGIAPLASLRPDLRGGAEPGNDAPRDEAGRLVAGGHAGLVTGHTHQPELVDLGGGFYANSGCGGPSVHRRPGRWMLPPAFAVARHTSWVEIEAGAVLRATLRVGQQELPSTTLLERACTRAAPVAAAETAVVAAWPDGQPWPELHQGWQHLRRVRLVAALIIAGAGLLDLVSAITPPVGDRLRSLSDIVPLAVSQAAAVLTVLAGVVLLLLARGVRRGQRHAWVLSLVLIWSSVALHVVKGFDFEEGLLAAVAGVWLLAHPREFRVKADQGATRQGILLLVVGALAAVTTGVVVTEVLSGDDRPTPSTALRAVAERMAGVSTVDLPNRIDRFLAPTLLATSFALIVAAAWVLFRPVIAARLSARPAEAAEQARRLVAGHGGDTLAYFALRDDKRWFFHGDTLVAYAIHQGVCLVSPDPIGPVVERREAWAAFRRFADDHGWPVAVMGASKGWLPIYRAMGMRCLYVGDEAVVDVRRFSLDGGRTKSLRQAVNRIDRNGYTIEFLDPATIEAGLRDELRALMRESRRGEVERGFSMTLGRVFDPEDTGLLLALCRGADGRPAAFCHFVPATAIDGYSLDLMRRSEDTSHPNGLTDFVIARTIEHLREQGHVGLGLNFAVMRSVLAGESGDKVTVRVQRWLLGRMSSSMQIESLWKFNAKFDPDWVPRYAVYDAPEYLLSSAVAVARAESFTELPLIGRFLHQSGDSAAADGPGAEPGPGPGPTTPDPTVDPSVPAPPAGAPPVTPGR